MENASKALIIAGAILLSILLISLGIMVYTNSKGTVEGSNLSKQEKEAFNSEWLSYEGTKTAVEVKTMIQAVNASNSTEEKNGKKKYIVVTKSSSAPSSNSGWKKNYSTSDITNDKTYTVKLGYSDGLVVSIAYY